MGRTARVDRPVFLLLHGTPLTPVVWDGVRPALEQHLPVLAPLLPAPSGPEGAQAELAAAVLSGLPVPDAPLHVVGHSFGAQVAIEVALLAPHRVASLALVCSRSSPFPAFASVAASMRDGHAPGVDASLQRWFTPTELAANGGVVRYARECLSAADHQMWADELDAIAVYDRRPALARIGAPSAVIAASADGVGTPEEMSSMAAALPRSTFEVLDGAAHMSPFLDPSSLAEKLIATARR